MKNPTWQYFSLEEYRQRLDALRRRMEQGGLDAILIRRTSTTSVATRPRATTGIRRWSSPLEGEPVFITRLLEESNVHHLS